MNNFIIIITFLFLGIIIKKVKDFPMETGKVLNSFVIYFSLPSLILLKIPDITFSKDLILAAIVPWIALLLSLVFVLFFSGILKWNRSIKACMLLLIPLGNTAFFGIPMVDSFFGEDYVSYAILYDQLGSFICLTTYGTLIIVIFGKGTTKPKLFDIFKRIFTFPPFIALAAAFILKPFSYPIIFVNILKLLSNTLIPLVMTAVGFQLTLKFNKRFSINLITGLILKLMIIPFVILLFFHLLKLSSDVGKVAVFQSGMPSMVTAGVLAMMADIEPELSAALVGFGIIFSFLTLPALYYFIGILL